MTEYKFTFGVEPTDKYLKAKQDLLQAYRSFHELTLQEQECLVTEVFGVTVPIGFAHAVFRGII